MSVRDELLRACAQGDEVTLKRHHWWPVWRALKTWWAKAFSLEDMRTYVRLLAGEPPDRIVHELEEWTKTKRGQFRPTPAEVMHALHGDDVAQDDRGSTRGGAGSGEHRNRATGSG